MEAIMPGSITQFLLGTAVAIAMAAASVGVIGSAVAQSPIERIQAIAPEAGHDATLHSAADARLGDRQQLRRMFLGN
jgi:hypothetical protein